MEKEFVPYDRALRMKALGFDEPCFSFYMGGFKDLGKIKYVNPSNVAETNVLAPTFSQAFRWFREKYNYNQSIVFTKHPFGTDEYQYMVLLEDDECVEINFKTYEEAELACLDKLIKIVEGIESQK